jgi:hypothetical protein
MPVFGTDRKSAHPNGESAYSGGADTRKIPGNGAFDRGCVETQFCDCQWRPLFCACNDGARGQAGVVRRRWLSSAV